MPALWILAGLLAGRSPVSETAGIEEFVDVSRHAWDRWFGRRATDPGHGPVVAWNRAERLPEIQDINCDEARYHEETDLVLLACEHDERSGVRAIPTMIRGASASAPIRDAIRTLTGAEERFAVVCESCGVLGIYGPTTWRTAEEAALNAVGAFTKKHDGPLSVQSAGGGVSQ